MGTHQMIWLHCLEKVEKAACEMLAKCCHFMTELSETHSDVASPIWGLWCVWLVNVWLSHTGSTAVNSPAPGRADASSTP